jgi:hypothetical protein
MAAELGRPVDLAEVRGPLLAHLAEAFDLEYSELPAAV